jgi:hypothetical protein
MRLSSFAHAHVRLASFLVAASLSSFAVGCTVSTTEPQGREPTPDPTTIPPAKEPQKTPLPQTPANPTVPDDGTFREVVHVYMTDTQKHGWYCTGTLVSPTTVVTAAHCLDTDKFVAYEIVAPGASGSPRVRATSPKVFGGSFEDVANPDFGFLTLEKSVTLPRYAEITNVTARVEAGEAVMAAAVVRKAQDPKAAFGEADALPVSSTVELGYEHGFGTPMFSKGGDSGAGLFLVEDGKLTHKLIAVARQPEPERDLDHFTRVDDELVAWWAANAPAAAQPPK